MYNPQPSSTQRVPPPHLRGESPNQGYDSGYNDHTPTESDRLLPEPATSTYASTIKSGTNQEQKTFPLAGVLLAVAFIIGIVVFLFFPPLEGDEMRRSFAWGDIRSQEQCISYGTKGYSAQLLKIPWYYNGFKTCMHTPIVIHGITYNKPNRCEIDNDGAVYGHWVAKNEPSCSTYWQYFEDKGCTYQGSGLRRIQGPLGGLHWQDDWQEMCSTTPAQFRGLHFDRPHSCDHWGKYGVWGIWLIEDSGC